jgi:hypothetical protein
MHKFLEICCSEIDLYLSNQNRFWKTERYFLRGACAGKNPLSLSKNTFPSDQNLSPKKLTKTGKTRFPNLVIFLNFRI